MHQQLQRMLSTEMLLQFYEDNMALRILLGKDDKTRLITINRMAWLWNR